jgi:tRNA (cytidine32/uridine32-2'-O)-methyltransferase
VAAYETRMAQLAGAGGGEAVPSNDEPPADAEQLERFFEHLAQTLDDIEFHKGRQPDTILLRLRKLFLRARPDLRELRVMHGIFADAQRMASLARKNSGG